MKVVQYIKDFGYEALTEDLGIKVKHYPERGVTVLNYCQIDSPKTNEVVRECRGLILNTNTLEVYCRPFHRFYNVGEAPETVEGFNIDTAVCYEKVDGSLIKVWYNPLDEQWEIATRGTAFAESDVNAFGLTFCDLVLRALNVSSLAEFNALVIPVLLTYSTYLFELTSMENRVVTFYEGTKLWFLGGVVNASGESFMAHSDGTSPLDFGACKVGEFRFNSVEACVSTAAGLPDLQEGYVLHDLVSGIRMKAKSPAYVAVHHLRGEGLNPKRIKQLVLTGEESEYLKYFPEDWEHLAPYTKALEDMLWLMDYRYAENKTITLQADFARRVGRYSFSCVLFKARRDNISPKAAWSTMNHQQRYKVFTNYCETKA